MFHSTRSQDKNSHKKHKQHKEPRLSDCFRFVSFVPFVANPQNPSRFGLVGGFLFELTPRTEPLYDCDTLSWFRQFKGVGLSGDQKRMLAYARVHGSRFTRRNYQEVIYRGDRLMHQSQNVHEDREPDALTLEPDALTPRRPSKTYRSIAARGRNWVKQAHKR